MDGASRISLWVGLAGFHWVGHSGRGIAGFHSGRGIVGIHSGWGIAGFHSGRGIVGFHCGWASRISLWEGHSRIS